MELTYQTSGTSIPVEQSSSDVNLPPSFVQKSTGQNQSRPPRAKLHESFKSAGGAFFGIFAVVLIDRFYLTKRYDNAVLMTGSYGAASVLLFNAYKSPLAQPWNAIMGQAISSVVGVSVRLFFTNILVIPDWAQAPFSVLFANFVMDQLDCLHPPGGATALTAVIGGPAVHKMGYRFALFTTCGALVMWTVAMLWNNAWKSRHYPLWWGGRFPHFVASEQS